MKFSMTPSNMEVATNLMQSQYMENLTQSEGYSILKNERLNTPALVQPQYVKQMMMSPPPLASNQRLGIKGAEIFGSTYSMDKRLAY